MKNSFKNALPSTSLKTRLKRLYISLFGIKVRNPCNFWSITFLGPKKIILNIYLPKLGSCGYFWPLNTNLMSYYSNFVHFLWKCFWIRISFIWHKKGKLSLYRPKSKELFCSVITNIMQDYAVFRKSCHFLAQTW